MSDIVKKIGGVMIAAVFIVSAGGCGTPGQKPVAQPATMAKAAERVEANTAKPATSYIVVPTSKAGIDTSEYFPIKSNDEFTMFFQSNTLPTRKINRRYLGQQNMVDGKAIYVVEERAHDIKGNGDFVLADTRFSYYFVDDFGNIRVAAIPSSVKPNEPPKQISWYSPAGQEIELVGRMEENKEYVIYNAPEGFRQIKISHTLVGQRAIDIGGQTYPSIIVSKKMTYLSKENKEKNREDVLTYYYAKGIGLMGIDVESYENGKIKLKMSDKYTVR